jgi:hypothetical protein
MNTPRSAMLARLAALIGLSEHARRGGSLPRRSKMAGRPWWKSGTSGSPHSKPPHSREKERARRRRQIAKGMLREENGLVRREGS